MDRPGWVRYTQKRFGLIGRQTFYFVLSLRTLLLAQIPYDMRAFAFALQEDLRNRRSGTRNEAS
jgi:hypothetical protein